MKFDKKDIFKKASELYHIPYDMVEKVYDIETLDYDEAEEIYGEELEDIEDAAEKMGLDWKKEAKRALENGGKHNIIQITENDIRIMVSEAVKKILDGEDLHHSHKDDMELDNLTPGDKFLTAAGDVVTFLKMATSDIAYFTFEDGSVQTYYTEDGWPEGDYSALPKGLQIVSKLNDDSALRDIEEDI